MSTTEELINVLVEASNPSHRVYDQASDSLDKDIAQQKKKIAASKRKFIKSQGRSDHPSIPADQKCIDWYKELNAALGVYAKPSKIKRLYNKMDAYGTTQLSDESHKFINKILGIR